MPLVLQPECQSERVGRGCGAAGHGGDPYKDPEESVEESEGVLQTDIARLENHEDPEHPGPGVQSISSDSTHRSAFNAHGH